MDVRLTVIRISSILKRYWADIGSIPVSRSIQLDGSVKLDQYKFFTCWYLCVWFRKKTELQISQRKKHSVILNNKPFTNTKRSFYFSPNQHFATTIQKTTPLFTYCFEIHLASGGDPGSIPHYRFVIQL